jgi:hypothetical protein
MNETTIPLISYILVGITSGVLALATILEKQPTENTNESSVNTMLPSFGNETKEPIPQAEAEIEKIPEAEAEKIPEPSDEAERLPEAKPVSGGKRNGKNKKTRNSKKGKKSTIKKSSKN